MAVRSENAAPIARCFIMLRVLPYSLPNSAGLDAR
jgi:hypothetical protein